jgi:predicted transcriptional regulator
MADLGSPIPSTMRASKRNVILLSIKPEFASKIYDGTKSIELRRVKPARFVQRVLVYETSPVSRITGWFTLRWIKSLPPKLAWSRFRKSMGIGRDGFHAYFRNCRNAILFAVSRIHRFVSGVKLTSLGRGVRPPQSFVYLASTVLRTRRVRPTTRPNCRSGQWVCFSCVRTV